MTRVPAKQLAQTDDEALAQAALDGDHLAFGELYRRYRPVVASYVHKRISTGTEDVIQTVFLRVHRGLPTYQGPRFFPWVYRLCVNVVTDELRSRRRQLETVVESVGDARALALAPTPEEELIARRLWGRLSRAVDRLPEKQRAVFLLAHVEGLDYAEIADLLSLPVGTVKSRMWQAVRTVLPEEGAER